jgi:hypothetical protein
MEDGRKRDGLEVACSIKSSRSPSAGDDCLEGLLRREFTQPFGG